MLIEHRQDEVCSDNAFRRRNLFKQDQTLVEPAVLLMLVKHLPERAQEQATTVRSRVASAADVENLCLGVKP